MNIDIVSIDGMALAAEAWRLSRDFDKSIEWEDIYTVDGPVNEFPSAVCHFRDFTILEREIFASNRTHVMWARTSFVDAPDKYTVPKDLLIHVDPLIHRSMRVMMEKGKAAGEHQDRWRRYLPVSAETSFSYRISYRDAVKFAQYFDHLQLCCSKSLVNRFAAIEEELKCLVDKFTGSRERTKKAVNMMRQSRFLHEGEITTERMARNGEMYKVPSMSDTGSIVVATFEVPFWIRAHFVRHRPVTVADDLFSLLQSDNVLNLSINHPIKMQVAASINIWQQLLGSRSCWLTQSTLGDEMDPWQAIVEMFLQNGQGVLPCSGGTCPHHRDARNRLEGTDPGVPCPRYMNLNSIDKTPWMEKLEHAAKSRGDFWLKELAA